MTSHLILSRSTETGPDPDAVVVPDRFSFPAFLLTIPWLLWHRVWFAAAPVIVAAVVSGWLAGDPRFALFAMLLSFIVQLYVGFEGNAWRTDAMIGRGWRLVDIVEAADAETAFELHALKTKAGTAPLASPPSLPSVPRRPAAAVSAIGLAGLGREV